MAGTRRRLGDWRRTGLTPPRSGGRCRSASRAAPRRNRLRYAAALPSVRPSVSNDIRSSMIDTYILCSRSLFICSWCTPKQDFFFHIYIGTSQSVSQTTTSRQASTQQPAHIPLLALQLSHLVKFTRWVPCKYICIIHRFLQYIYTTLCRRCCCCC